MSVKIIDTPPRYSQPEVNFVWTPSTGYASYGFNGNVYPPSGIVVEAAEIGTPITFTATVRLSEPGAYVVKYEWDLGDGTKAQGNPVTHTFRATTKSSTGQSGRDTARTVLCVTDNLNRTTCVGKQILLRTGQPITIAADRIRLGGGFPLATSETLAPSEDLETGG